MINIYYTSGSNHFAEIPVLKEYFNLLPYDTNIVDSIVIVDVTDKHLVSRIEQKNNRVILSNVFEPVRTNNLKETGVDAQGRLRLLDRFFFWTYEYYSNQQRGNHLIDTFASIGKEYAALMPMNLKRDHRERTIEKFTPLLNRMLWSYRDNKLPGDQTSFDDRWVNPDWYKKTYCSVVVETAVTDQLFLSEKTFKPIAYGHPFLILAQPGALNRLRKAGFETFDNIFDESYDEMDIPVEEKLSTCGGYNRDYLMRLDSVYQNVESICANKYDDETIRRIKHNRALFNDVNRIRLNVKAEIIEPILEYAETR